MVKVCVIFELCRVLSVIITKCFGISRHLLEVFSSEVIKFLLFIIIIIINIFCYLII